MAEHSTHSLKYEPAEGPVLVVGSKIYDGRPDWRLQYPTGIGLDMLPGDGVDLVHNLEDKTPENLLGHFGHIDCVSILEHTQRPWIVSENLQGMLRPGGSIYLTVPFIWRHHGYPFDYWRITHSALPVLFPQIEWKNVGYLTGGQFIEGPQKKYGRQDGHKFLIKSEVVGFGVKKCD